jgi:DNA-binding XRE family transcriptional regulator
MHLASISPPAVLIERRKLLERDRPEDFRAALAEIRALTGYGTSELCFIINVSRGTLWHWENDAEPNPSYEDGRAILKLRGIVRYRPPTGT